MIKRVVKLVFRSEAIEAFKKIFEDKKKKIRGSEGCLHLELWQNKHKPNEFFTYSFWESEDDLNNYRHSELFKETWAQTKVLFDDKPMAWTVDGLEYLP